MPLELIIVIVIVSYLRKHLKTAVTMPEWNKKLLWVLYVTIALIILHVFVKRFDTIIDWLSFILLALVINEVYRNEKFSDVRFFVTATVPYLVASFLGSFIKLIAPGFYNDWSNWIDASQTVCNFMGDWYVDSYTKTAERTY